METRKKDQVIGRPIRKGFKALGREKDRAQPSGGLQANRGSRVLRPVGGEAQGGQMCRAKTKKRV